MQLKPDEAVGIPPSSSEPAGGGVRGYEVSRRSVRGYQTAVCVDVDTQGGCFGGDEAERGRRIDCWLFI